MSTTIDIDIGGTFTDCVVVRDEQVVSKKTLTTRHNLSMGFRRVIEDSARELGDSLDDLLLRTDMIRYSTTVAMNTLIERKGPRLGFITTAGHEHMLYIGRARQWADGLHPSEWRHVAKIRKPDLLVPLDLTVGVHERVDCMGNVVEGLNPDEVRDAVRYLVDQGVRGFVVCLLWSFINPVHEQQIKAIIQEEYPDTYLGNMPVMLSSEVHPKWHEYPRANVTLLNAYLQTEMTEQLRGLADELRDHGYRRPLMVINNVGGMAKIARTRAVDTYGAGPVAGLFGAAHLGQQYGYPNIVVSDMGGTSFDFGLVTGGTIDSYSPWPVVDRFATEMSVIEVKTLGAGGGSIAWVNRSLGNVLEVGPTSAGSNPGPVCYNLGGTEPTVTDADVVLGYIDPEYFLGGRMRLDLDKARRAIEEKIARPLGLGVEEAAMAISKVVGANMGNTIAKELYLKGHNPSDFVLFAYGGAGPTHCCEYGSYLGTPKIVTFPFASVFCAMGGSTMDLVHNYEQSRHIPLYNPYTASGSPFFDDYEQFNTVVTDLQKAALRDMTGEGFQADQVRFTLEVEMRYGGQYHLTRVASPSMSLHDVDGVKALYDAFNTEYERRYSALTAYPEAGIEIENFCLTARVPLSKLDLPRHELHGPDAGSARKGVRPVYWEEAGTPQPTAIYDMRGLCAGNVVEGPAVLEAVDTTCVVPPGWRFTVDQYLNGILERR